MIKNQPRHARISMPFILAAILFTFPVFLQAQQKTVTGTVRSAQTLEPIANATVLVKGTTRGTSTNEKGQYSLSASPKETISISAVGYILYEALVGNRFEISIDLASDDKQMEEVVVTALGIKRNEKALGYSISTVKGEDLTDAISNNWTDALTGKVAGLNLVKSGGGPAGSNQIILRGETSLTGDNSALIVVDGVVISGSSGTMTGQGSGNYQSGDAPVDFGSSLADINPNDIESVSVLKGPGAAALYGARGANGAIIITTKQGKGNQKGIGVNFNSNTSLGFINRWPDYQYEYGQGVGGGDLYYSYGQSADGPSTLSTSSAWGPKFDGQMYYQYNPDPAFYRLTPTERTLWRPYENNRKDFFRPSLTLTNSLSLSGGNEKTTTRLSYTNVKNEWIIPNTGYNRHAVALQLKHKIIDKLSVSTNITYNKKSSDNLPNTGYNNQTIMYFMRGITPNMNLDWFKQYWRPGREGIEQTTPFSNLLDNPYFQAKEVSNSQDKNGFIGTAQANYEFNKYLNLMVRTALDFQYDQRKQTRPFDTYRFPNGYYRETNIYTQETTNDFLLQYNNKNYRLFKFGVNLGGAMMKNKYIKDDAYTEKLTYPGIFNFANSAENLRISPLRQQYAVNSLYSLANVSFKEYLFLDGSMRVDWASTLASVQRKKVDPFFYPSVNSSLIITEAFNLPKTINFWKIRGSVAKVGSGGTRPYLTAYNYTVAQNFTSGLQNPTIIPNEDLRYENTLAYEVGTDIRMFKSRLTLDVTAYISNSYDQILVVPIDPSSGYAYQVINAGDVRNRGLEMELSGKILNQKGKLNWKAYGNMGTNDSKILSLPNEEGKIVLSTVYGSRGTIEARVGGKFGDMYGYGYKRNSAGQIIYKTDGLPETSEDLMYIGNVNATLKAGFGNEFTYKGFRLNILFDGQFGGVGYSLTHAVLMEEGKLKKTLPGRYNGIIGNGVVDNGDGTFSPNTTPAAAQPFYYAHFNRDQIEANTFSTDFIKFREFRLDYTIPARITQKIKLQKAVVGIYGRDLLVFSKWPAFDPEFGSLNADGIQKGAEVAQFPSTNTLGFNLSISL